MRPREHNSATVSNVRKQLERSGTLHWFHWVIVALSLLLTVGAWYFAHTQLEEKIKFQFEREADQVVALIVERMQKYEDGLWSGVGLIHTMEDDMDYPRWATFAKSLRIEEKYPGINGISVIYHVTPDRLEAYLTDQRRIPATIYDSPSAPGKRFFADFLYQPFGTKHESRRPEYRS